MNRLTVTGTVFADPVSVVLADGSLLATFTVADSTRPERCRVRAVPLHRARGAPRPRSMSTCPPAAPCSSTES